MKMRSRKNLSERSF